MGEGDGDFEYYHVSPRERGGTKKIDHVINGCFLNSAVSNLYGTFQTTIYENKPKILKYIKKIKKYFFAYFYIMLHINL